MNTSSDSTGLVSNQHSQHPSRPRHVAIIMDGNNRWAKKRLLPSVRGHRAGVEVIRRVLSGCEKDGVEALTLFAFSSENWQRPEKEVSALMKLFGTYLEKEVAGLHEKGIRICFAGRRDRLAAAIVEKMVAAEVLTRDNTGRTLVLAVDYGGKWDIVNAAKEIASKVVSGQMDIDSIDEQAVASCLSMPDLPAPDLCIRTGSESRISNFLLWQLAYAELYFTDCYWPDFDEAEWDRAMEAFGQRQRRFGKTGDQQTAGV